jgi:hypothetical protein
MERTATAIALATVLVAMSFVGAPAAAEDTDCHESFQIADSESLAQDRVLDPGERDIGRESMIADQTLTVELQTSNDELEWSVHRLDADGNCVQYKSSACSGKLVSSGEKGECTLEIADDDEFFVELENVEPSPADSLDYQVWAV